MSKLKKAELIHLARRLKIKYYSKFKKGELITEILNNFSEKQIKAHLNSRKKRWLELLSCIGAVVTIIAFIFSIFFHSSSKTENRELEDKINVLSHEITILRDKIIYQNNEARIKREVKEDLSEEIKGEGKERGEALRAFEKGNLDEAEKLLEKLRKKQEEKKIQRSIENSKTTYILGNIYFLRKKFNKALSAFLDAHSLDSTESKYKKSIALVYLILSKPGKAIDYFKKALSDDIKNYGEMDVVVARDWNNLGLAWFLTKNHENAIKCYKNAFKIFLKLEGFSEKWIILNNLGFAYYESGHYKEAGKCYEESLKITRKNGEHSGEGKTLNNLGKLYNKLGQFEKSLDFYNKALVKFKLISDLWGEAETLNGIGAVYSSQRNYDKALVFFEKAAELMGRSNLYKKRGEIYLYPGDKSKVEDIYNKALPFFEKIKDSLNQGNRYWSKGNIYSKNGDNSRALEMYDKALTFFNKEGDLKGQGNVYLSKGDIYLRIGNNSKALELYDKALSFFVNVGYHIGQGNVYLSKGDIYLRIGNNLKALELYENALLYFKKVGYLIGQGNVYLSKGVFYFRLGNNSKALYLYDKALSFFVNVGYHIGQGNVYLSKGDIYLRIGDNPKALKMYDEAMSFFKKAKQPIGQGNIYWRKGDIYRRTKDTSMALELYDKALPFFEKAEYPIGQGNVYRSKGHIYFNTGNNLRALKMHDKALIFYEEAGNIELESAALHDKAKVLLKLGKKDEALELFEKGINSLEKVRIQTAFSEMKISFLNKVYKRYEEAVLFMMENNQYEKGFKYIESMKARVFLDRMYERLVPLEKGLKPELKVKRDNLVAKLSILSKAMYKTGVKEEKKLAELKEKFRNTQSEFEELLIKIRLENPLYTSIRYPEPISVKVLQKMALKKGEILLRYFISPDKVYVFLVSKQSFKLVPLEVKAVQIRYYVQGFLQDYSTRDMEMYGKLLYRELFKPIESKLKGSRDIIIIPDSHLARIPFESFIIDEEKSGRPQFLLEKYRVKYIQSASLLSVLRKHYRRDSKTKNFTGFGDPVYDYENFKQVKTEKGALNRFLKGNNEIRQVHRSGYTRASGIMNRLPSSGEEVKAIAQLFEKKSQKCTVYLRDQATEENAKATDMKNFDFIHFSCHGLLNEDFQSLVLSQLPADQSQEDGYFTMNEIMNCDYNAKLVVLSACQTGSGKMERAEGVTGLTRAVMYAGTPAVIASLWKIEDTATKELMVTFYRNMLENNMDKAEALRQAKLELIKTKKYRSPLFWSAFVMYGE